MASLKVEILSALSSTSLCLGIVLIYGGMRFAYFKGYELGDKAVEFLVGPKGQALRKAISVIGGMVIGAVAATWVSVTTSLELKNADGGKPS